MTTNGSKLNAEQVIAALKDANGNMALAGRRLKVSRQAIKYYVDNYPTVAAAHDEAAAYISDIAEGHLVNAVLKGNLDQARYWLENKARDRGYGRAPTNEPGPPVDWSRVSEADQVAFLDGKLSLADVLKRQQPRS